jgi:hypothetical protein
MQALQQVKQFAVVFIEFLISSTSLHSTTALLNFFISGVRF